MIKNIHRFVFSKSLSDPRKLIYSFCEQVQAKKKSYVMPESIEQKKFYYPTKTIKFMNGRKLLYLNKQNLLTPYLLGMHYTIPLIYVVYLTFPAALPLNMIIETVLLLMWIEHKSFHKRHIQRVYLMPSGLEIEIVYSNKIRRYAKNNPAHTFHEIMEFENRFQKDLAENRIKHYKGVRFPKDPYAPFEQAQQPTALQYGWTVRDRDFNNYVLPAEFQYADWELLSKVLNGVQIILHEDKTIYEGEQIDQDKYPSIEEEMKNLPQLLQEQKVEGNQIISRIKDSKSSSPEEKKN